MSVNSAEFAGSDAASVQEQVIQHAVHLATVKTVGEQGVVVQGAPQGLAPAGAPQTPNASPTGQMAAAMAANGQISANDAMAK